MLSLYLWRKLKQAKKVYLPDLKSKNLPSNSEQNTGLNYFLCIFNKMQFHLNFICCMFEIVLNLHFSNTFPKEQTYVDMLQLGYTFS